jgi:hypothetical protein
VKKIIRKFRKEGKMRFPVLMFLAVLASAAQDACPWSRDVRLVNGKIHTLDPQDRVVSEVTIQEGRFAYIGPLGNRKVNPCTESDRSARACGRPGTDRQPQSFRVVQPASRL